MEPHATGATTPDNDVATTKSYPESLVPPYWQHRRQISHASVVSNASHTGKPPPIILEDHTEEPEGLASPLWAKAVQIENNVIVSGNITGVGDYVVWICKVFVLDVCFGFSHMLLPWQSIVLASSIIWSGIDRLQGRFYDH